jgi:hypothetical protein
MEIRARRAIPTLKINSVASLSREDCGELPVDEAQELPDNAAESDEDGFKNEGKG